MALSHRTGRRVAGGRAARRVRLPGRPLRLSDRSACVGHRSVPPSWPGGRGCARCSAVGPYPGGRVGQADGVHDLGAGVSRRAAAPSRDRLSAEPGRRTVRDSRGRRPDTDPRAGRTYRSSARTGGFLLPWRCRHAGAVGTSGPVVSDPAGNVLALFGITGDLARKMILPALYRLAERGVLTVPVVGVALTDWDTDRLREHVGDSVRAALGSSDVDDAVLRRLQAGVHLVAGDYADAGTFDRLAAAVREQAGEEAFAVHYLAVPPGLFATVADGLAAAGLAERARLVVEKPFGSDLASARQLDARLRRHFPEERIFRVDHYLGKEPVEDLLVLRFANTLL